MVDWPLLLLVIVAIGVGFWLGRRSMMTVEEEDDSALESHYIKGVNYLLNEQPDEAIDTFVEVLEVNPQTLETHLALGNLLRRRGEVGRAIKVHQNLLARPSLSPIHSQQVQLELAKDFIKSGLLDRAEVLLQELVINSEHGIRCTSLEYLIEIYRDEKEWLKAIETVNQLAGRRFGRMVEKWRHVQAHFFCELAEQALARKDYLLVRRYLKSALAVDKASVRGHLLSAEVDFDQGRTREAIRSLKEIVYSEPDYIPEVLPLLVQIYHQQNRVSDLLRFLQSIYAHTPGSTLLVCITQLILEMEGEEPARTYLLGQLQYKPTFRALKMALELTESSHQAPSEILTPVMGVLQRFQDSVASYRCGKCGFSGNQLHWMCPSCKNWGSVSPIHGVEGE